MENNNNSPVGVVGATSFVGTCLLQQLISHGMPVVAFSRRQIQPPSDNIEWRKLTTNFSSVQTISDNKIVHWISLAPIMTLPNYFNLFEAYGVQKIVALSSTSRFTKENSSDPNEQILAKEFAVAEANLQSWAEKKGVEWVVLRPTLIYGFGRDKNIGEITHFIQRFGFFPVFGKAVGLRQPVHVQDVAKACLATLQTPVAANCSYNISGAEILTYRAMVSRVFSALGKRPRLLSIPLWMFSVAVILLRSLPRYRKWSSAMAERMNYDMVFDHSNAKKEFSFESRPFVLSSEDVPVNKGIVK